jgi:protease I
MTGGVEQVEYTEPRGYLEARGVAVTLVSPKAAGEEIQAFNHLTPASTFKVERNADKRVTSWPSLEVDQEVVIDGKLVASRKPADIPAFSRAVHVLFEDADMCPPRLGAT